MKARLRFATALASFALAASAFAAPIQIRSGDVAFTMPEPPGLAAMTNTNARYFTFSNELQAKSGNRLLAAMLPPAEAKSADAGDMPSPNQWALVFSHIKMGTLNISVREFKGGQDQIIAGLESAFGGKFTDNVNSNTNAAVGNLLKELGAPAGSVKLRVGQIVPLGLYARQDNHITYGAAARVAIEADGKTEVTPIVMMITMVSAKNRLLSFALYRHLKGREDIDAAKAQMAAWTQQFLKANP